MFCVQAHAFNGQFEPLDSTIQEYLMSFRHMIISFKMMDRLIEYWNSNKIEWHIDRGLKLNSDGNMPPPGTDARHAISSGHLLQMNRYQR